MTHPTPHTHWIVDDDGYLVSPSGTRCGRLQGNALLLYDKRTKTAIPFTMTDWAQLRHRCTTAEETRNKVLTTANT